jgi:hypothetical protein
MGTAATGATEMRDYNPATDREIVNRYAEGAWFYMGNMQEAISDALYDEGIHATEDAFCDGAEYVSGIVAQARAETTR